MSKLTLSYDETPYAVCRLDRDQPLPLWLNTGSVFISITRTDDELSIVCPSSAVPASETARVEKNWRALKVEGPLDFALTGILLSIARPLAAEKISIFAISTFDTDYILIKEDKFDLAVITLEKEFNVRKRT